MTTRSNLHDLRARLTRCLDQVAFMTKSRFIFTRITGEPSHEGYIVRSRRTGLILGNVWKTYDPYSTTTTRGWCAYGRSGYVYPTRLAAAKDLKP